jgi:two-component system OmpR family sensor kinase
VDRGDDGRHQRIFVSSSRTVRVQLPSAVRRVHYGGLLVAITGFLISAILAQTIPAEMTIPLVVSGVVPLVVGLGLSAFGVALAVGTVPQAYVTTVARWCLTGATAMVLVFLLTAVGSDAGGVGGAFRASEELVANVLLAGAVGGVLIGDRSAKNRRQRREIRRQANRGIVLNRVLRDEVLNAVTVIEGYAPLISDPEGTPERTSEAIGEATRQIERTVEEVGAIADDPEDRPLRPTDLAEHLRKGVDAVRDRDPETTISVDDARQSASVRADERVGIAIRGLLRHATENATGGEVAVSLAAGRREQRIEVSYRGSPLEPEDRALLRSGELPEYDDPTVGFDLQTAWLLVDRYGGRIDAENGSGETRIVVSLPRAAPEDGPASPIGASNQNLLRASFAGIVAGVTMGLSVQAFGSGLPIIGALYGVESAAVGWITHLFHSVVFALLFVAVTSWPPLRDRTGSVPAVTGIGIAWGLLLAFVAAGVLMPAWLDAVGFDAMLPNISTPGLLGHVLWGLVLGGTYGFLREQETGFGDVGRGVVSLLDVRS